MTDKISKLNNSDISDAQQTSAPVNTIAKPPLISISDLLSQTWALYKKRAKVFLLILLIPVIPVVLNITYGFLSAVLLGPWSLVIGSLASLMGLAGFFAGIWAGLALIFAVIDGQLSLRQAFVSAWHKLLSYLWLVILSSLIIAGGVLLFVVPGIIFSLQFVFAVYVFVVEGLKGREALLKSKAYIKGYWWAVFGRLLVLQLLIMLAFLPLGFIFGFGSLVIGLSHSSLISFVSGLLMSIFPMGLSVLIAPFSLIYSFLLYQDVKSKKPNLVFELKTKDKIYLTLWAVWVIVAVGLMIGLIIIGVLFFRSSDTDLAKNLRDSTRKIHTIRIMTELDIYYGKHQQYPASLSDLQQDSSFIIPKDPKTRQVYEYELMEQEQNFSLCFSFEKKDKECFDKDDLDTGQEEYQQNQQSDWPQDQSSQFNFLWIKFAKKPAQWFSALIGTRNLLTR